MGDCSIRAKQFRLLHFPVDRWRTTSTGRLPNSECKEKGELAAASGRLTAAKATIVQRRSGSSFALSQVRRRPIPIVSHKELAMSSHAASSIRVWFSRPFRMFGPTALPKVGLMLSILLAAATVHAADFDPAPAPDEKEASKPTGAASLPLSKSRPVQLRRRILRARRRSDRRCPCRSAIQGARHRRPAEEHGLARFRRRPDFHRQLWFEGTDHQDTQIVLHRPDRPADHGWPAPAGPR